MIDLSSFEENLKRHLELFKDSLKVIRTGNPSVQDIENIEVVAYGGEYSKLRDVATFNFESAVNVIVNLYDNSIRSLVVGSLTNNDKLGATVSDDGKVIRLKFNTLTSEDKARKLKELSEVVESYKVRMRKERQEINAKIKDLIVREDEKKLLLEKVQKLLDQYVDQIDSLAKDKKVQLQN
jgi:ribosome recycling factor